jgi:hypothetical protein
VSALIPASCFLGRFCGRRAELPWLRFDPSLTRVDDAIAFPGLLSGIICMCGVWPERRSPEDARGQRCMRLIAVRPQTASMAGGGGSERRRALSWSRSGLFIRSVHRLVSLVETFMLGLVTRKRRVADPGNRVSNVRLQSQRINCGTWTQDDRRDSRGSGNPLLLAKKPVQHHLQKV